jgi:hypothetical protein
MERGRIGTTVIRRSSIPTGGARPPIVHGVSRRRIIQGAAWLGGAMVGASIVGA